MDTAKCYKSTRFTNREESSLVRLSVASLLKLRYFTRSRAKKEAIMGAKIVLSYSGQLSFMSKEMLLSAHYCCVRRVKDEGAYESPLQDGRNENPLCCSCTRKAEDSYELFIVQGGVLFSILSVEECYFSRLFSELQEIFPVTRETRNVSLDLIFEGAKWNFSIISIYGEVMCPSCGSSFGSFDSDGAHSFPVETIERGWVKCSRCQLFCYAPIVNFP